MPWVEIIHWRETEEGCEHVVFIDGVEVPADVHNIDPGRGWTRTEWDQQTEYEVSNASELVGSLLRVARNDAADESEDVR